MKRMISVFMILALLLAGCQGVPQESTAPPDTEPLTQPTEPVSDADGVVIGLSDEGILVGGAPLDPAVSESTGVHTANDIVYYPTGKDFTFGEGTEADAHEQSEADKHTVVHITRPGTYVLTGKLSAGQIAVDLGEDAEEDPNAVVTLILDGVDITCTVAPAVIFYNVYECGNPDEANAVVDTSAAGANVIIADGSVNNVNGSYVARIYKEGTVVLSEDGTEVEDAKKLHKYDGAFYSRMSMNVSGGEIGDGILNIHAENEGLDSELHLTLNGGHVNIVSGNDGINTNEDGISVTTINGGVLTITVSGETGEGDGIDSNGWLVINGGTVIASACSVSGDAGIDSDMGIYLNGGTVMATGNMLDRIAGGEQTYAVFQFNGTQAGGSTYTLKNEAGEAAMECTPVNDFAYLILAGDALTPGTYTFWQGQTQLAGSASGGMGGMMQPGEGGAQPGQVPGQIEGEPPEGDYQIPPQPGQNIQPNSAESGQTGTDIEIQEETRPDGMDDRFNLGQVPGQIEGEPPEGDYQIPPQPGQTFDPMGGGFGQTPAAPSTEFVISEGGNQFVFVGPAEQ